MTPISRISKQPQIELHPLPKAIHHQFSKSTISESGSCFFAPFRAVLNFFSWIKSLICCKATKPIYNLPKFTLEEFADLTNIPSNILRQESDYRFSIYQELKFKISLEKSGEEKYIAEAFGATPFNGWKAAIWKKTNSMKAWDVTAVLSEGVVLEIVPYGGEDFAIEARGVTAEDGFEDLPTKATLILKGLADKVDLDLAKKYRFSKRGNDLIRSCY